MRYLLLLLAFLGVCGCDTPYTHPLTVDDWVQAQGQDIVCLDDGFDSVCIKVIAGTTGRKRRTW